MAINKAKPNDKKTKDFRQQQRHYLLGLVLKKS
jgi:hypothetical protein